MMRIERGFLSLDGDSQINYTGMVLDDQGQKERKARNIRTTTTNRHDGMEI